MTTNSGDQSAECPDRQECVPEWKRAGFLTGFTMDVYRCRSRRHGGAVHVRAPDDENEIVD